MADLSLLNIGGSDYNVKDATARTNSIAAQTLTAYRETGNTASQAYSVVGTPINWKGTLYYTKTAVAAGATWAVGTNLVAANNLGKLVSNIKTYVNSDGELVFRDLTGADTVLPFSGTAEPITVTVALQSYGDRGSCSATVYCNGVAVTSAGISMSQPYQGWSASGTGTYTPE